MIYTELTMKAMQIAYAAHHGQFDQVGVPYIFHPMHVAEQMDDEITTCVALLHDIVEDTDVTFDELEFEFPPEVLEPLELLTHEEGEPYSEYIERLKDDPVAKTVKLADLDHNSDETRYTRDITEEKKAYWREKYGNAKKILMGE